MNTKHHILFNFIISILLMMMLQQEIAAQRTKAGQEGSVKRSISQRNRIHPSAQALDPACLGGKYNYVVSGYYESIIKVFLIDPSVGVVQEGTRIPVGEAPNLTMDYLENIIWQKAGVHEIGVVETSVINGIPACTSDTVYYTVNVQALDLGLSDADKYFCYGDTLSIESKVGTSPFNVSWYESATGDIKDTSLIVSGNKPRIDKVTQSGNYWVIARDAIGCQSWSDLHVKDRPQIGFSYNNTSGNADNKLAADTIKFIATNDAGVLQVQSDLVADKITWSSPSIGLSSDLTNRLDDNHEFNILNLSTNDVLTPTEFKLKVEVGTQIDEVTSIDKYCSTSDTLLIYRVSTNTSVTNLHGNFVIPEGTGANEVFREWNLDNVKNYVNEKGDKEYSKMVVIIYDRWGRMVFQSSAGYTENFKGKTNSGTELPADSYHYVIKRNDGSIGDIGNVTVIR